MALRSAVRTIGGVFGGAEAIPVVETTTRSLRNVPKGKELVHQLPKKEARIRKINRFLDSHNAVYCYLSRGLREGAGRITGDRHRHSQRCRFAAFGDAPWSGLVSAQIAVKTPLQLGRASATASSKALSD